MEIKSHKSTFFLFFFAILLKDVVLSCLEFKNTKKNFLILFKKLRNSRSLNLQL